MATDGPAPGRRSATVGRGPEWVYAGVLPDVSRYSITLRWSERDDQYVVSFPEFGSFARASPTGERRYDRALNAGVLLLGLIAHKLARDGTPLPTPGGPASGAEVCRVH